MIDSSAQGEQVCHVKPMKPRCAIGQFLFFFALLRSASGQNFTDLNFESANIPKSTVPGSSVSLSEGLPGWTVSCQSPDGGGTNIPTTIPYDAISLGGVFVSIDNTNTGFGFSPLQGKYSVLLFGGQGDAGDFEYSAQISQTGLVPVGTESLQLDAALFSGPPFIVTLGGQTINMSPLQDFSNFTDFGANIPSSLAGQVETLSIIVPAPAPPITFFNELELDNIQFSSSPVPEPGVLGLFGLGTLIFCCLRKKPRPAFRGWQRPSSENSEGV